VSVVPPLKLYVKQMRLRSGYSPTNRMHLPLAFRRSSSVRAGGNSIRCEVGRVTNAYPAFSVYALAPAQQRTTKDAIVRVALSCISDLLCRGNTNWCIAAHIGATRLSPPQTLLSGGGNVVEESAFGHAARPSRIVQGTIASHSGVVRCFQEFAFIATEDLAKHPDQHRTLLSVNR
jgi:hypothetical protein